MPIDKRTGFLDLMERANEKKIKTILVENARAVSRSRKVNEVSEWVTSATSSASSADRSLKRVLSILALAAVLRSYIVGFVGIFRDGGGNFKPRDS